MTVPPDTPEGRRPRRRAVMWVLAATAAGAAAVAAAVALWPGGPGIPTQVAGEQVVAPAAGDETAEPFTVAGNVDGLFPGGTLPLRLTLTNPNGRAISVSELTVAVGDAPDCPGATLEPGPFAGPVVIPAGGRATTVIPVRMAASAEAACQAATFPLTYGGRAEET